MTAGQLIPRADSWLGFFGKLIVLGSFIIAAVNFVLLDNEKVRIRLASAVGMPRVVEQLTAAQTSAGAALDMALRQQTTLDGLSGQILTFTGVVSEFQEQVNVTQAQMAESAAALAAMTTRLDQMTTKLLDLDERRKGGEEAPMIMVEPERIEDVALGGRTRVTIRFSQERDCGRADHWSIRFRDSAGLSGAFEDLSVNDSEGFGPRFDAAPGSFRDYTFTAGLPGDDLFSPGVAQGRVIVSGWQLCPNAAEARSPAIPFTILPAAAPKRR